MATVAKDAPTVATDEPAYRLSLRQYHRMSEAGGFTENDRVELIEGQLIANQTRNPPHDTSVDLTQSEITAVLPEGWRLRVQSAITITTRASEPEPDVTVVRGPARRYARFHPRPNDIALLVEVAETPLYKDRPRSNDSTLAPASRSAGSSIWLTRVWRFTRRLAVVGRPAMVAGKYTP